VTRWRNLHTIVLTDMSADAAVVAHVLVQPFFRYIQNREENDSNKKLKKYSKEKGVAFSLFLERL
jgi:hypothetical protein